MSNEWRDLPTMADVAAAQTAGDEIQSAYVDAWVVWNGKAWSALWSFRARPMQPKMKKVKILGWANKIIGSTITLVEGARISTEWIRYPKLDDEIEVPCE